MTRPTVVAVARAVLTVALLVATLLVLYFFLWVQRPITLPSDIASSVSGAPGP